MDGELKFEYQCNMCGKVVRMNTNDIIKFIGTRYGTSDGDQLEEFFTPFGKQYNLCTECSREEGFEADDFEGWEE